LIWAEQTLKEEQWNLGDYSSLGADWEDRLREAAKNGVSRADKEATPDLKNAADKVNSAYNSLISDVLSKGFENINLADYEGLFVED